MSRGSLISRRAPVSMPRSWFGSGYLRRDHESGNRYSELVATSKNLICSLSERSVRSRPARRADGGRTIAKRPWTTRSRTIETKTRETDRPHRHGASCRIANICVKRSWHTRPFVLFCHHAWPARPTLTIRDLHSISTKASRSQQGSSS